MSVKDQITRRQFISGAAGGLVVGLFLPAAGRLFGTGEVEAADLLADGAAFDASALNAWVRIAPSGTAELMFGGCEMGQGTMTGLAQLLAEELKVDWNKIVIKRPDTNENPNTPVTPYTSSYLGTSTFRYGTGGSSGISRRWLPLRVAGAQARELLVAGAMLKLRASGTEDTDRTHYVAAHGEVTHVPTSTRWSYGALVSLAATPDARVLVPFIDDATRLLTATADFKIIGQRLQRPDIPAKTSGAAKFGIDVFLPGMMFAVVKHCPTVGGVLSTTPATPTGAIKVVPLKAYDNRGAVVKDSWNALAVVADNTWKANKLAKSLKITWKLPTSTASVDTATIAQVAQQRLATPGAGMWLAEPVATTDPTVIATNEAAVTAALGSATAKVQATFNLPYVPHATMEVPNCTASVVYSGTTPVTCEIWAPTQNASSVIATASALTGLPASSILVHTTFLGGGLGRKIEMDYVSQAIQTSMAVKAPVKVMWPREEDFANDQFRPMAAISVKAGLDSAKKISAWSYRVATPSISWQRATATNNNKLKLDGQAVEGAVALPYTRGSSLTEWVPLDSDVAGLPVGYWRSVGASMNVFAAESIIDMLADAAGEDPFTFRMNRITDARTLAVLAAADTLSAWRKTLPAGRAWGMAISKAFGTTVCEVVDVSRPALGTMKVNRVACVVDCGIAVNPDAVEAQMQGGVIHGLNATLWGNAVFKLGIAQQLNFNKNRMMRLGDAPEIQVAIVQNTYDPSGTGEPAVPPVAPAIANAWYRLTKTRVTSLPFFPGATMGGL